MTGSEHLTVLALNAEPFISPNSDNSHPQTSTHPPPIPPKTGHQVKGQKPVIPPKPLNITTHSGLVSQTCSPEPPISNQNTPSVLPKKTPFKKTHLHEKETLNFNSLDTSNKLKNKQHNISEPVQRPGDPMDIQKMKYTEQWVHNSRVQNMDNPTGTIENVDDSSLACNKIGMEKNVIQKINAAEEIRMCMQNYSVDTSEELNMGFKVALQNFGEKKTATADTTSSFPKKMKVVPNKTIEEQATNEVALPLPKKDKGTDTPEKHNESYKDHSNTEKKVVLREKKVKRETEDERRQRLSVHKEDIIKGNVKAAMEIFENLMRREELKIILSKVQEIEGETCEVDVRSLKTLYENMPAWIAGPTKNTKHRPSTKETRSETEGLRDDLESVSSVEAAFEDLEKASMDIIRLKEQTLAKLMDIEEAIKKALYSVSNLKSEADIAGLSGLFSESLNADNVSPSTNNIRKISIVSSKSKPVQSKQIHDTDKTENSEVLKEARKPCSNLPSSPSFISIHSAARKPVDTKVSDQLKASSTFKQSSTANNHICSAQSPKRKVSVLEVQTVPQVESGIIGTQTVSEKYEEVDCFGNTYFSTKRSTFVTKQSETESSSSYDVVTNSGRYDAMTSPMSQRSGHTLSTNSLSKRKDGKVFVTFGHSNTEKH